MIHQEKNEKEGINEETKVKEARHKEPHCMILVYINYSEQVNPWRPKADWWLPRATGSGEKGVTA